MPGELIGGRYRLEELIGSGGMGDVFRAHDTLLERSVAIKLVDTFDPRRREETSQSFLREARISAAIAHRNVVQILDFGVDNQTVPFIVMELLSGESLADVLGRGEKVPTSFVLELADQVLDGLAAAHEAGVVHRDLKPENIYLARGREQIVPKLLDFGISKLTDERGSARVTTTQGHVVGTPAYMSPEQARGLKFLDKRTDLYSMGVVLYELLSGEMPFYSENPGDLMVMIVTSEPAPLSEKVPGIPPALSDVIARAMQKKPDARFADAQEMRLALRQASLALRDPSAASQLDQRAWPTSWRRRSEAARDAATREAEVTPHAASVRPRMSRRPLLLGLGLTLVASIAGITTVLVLRSSQPPTPRFIVVQADAPRETAQEVGTPLTASTGVATSSPAEPSVAPAPTGKKSESRRPADPASRIAESFRRQKGPVEACVNRHADEAERTPKLSVRISVDGEGRVQSARVQPASLANGTLGQCIERSVRAMQFPGQGKALAFEVPLTARKGS